MERFGDRNAPNAILQAAQFADSLREDALATGQSLAFETVLSTEGKLDYLRRAKAAGYFIRVFFVGTESPAINAARITERFIKGGHEVPITKIVARYGRSMANSVLAARIADRAYFYDNTPENESVRLVFRCKGGRPEKIYTQLPGWAAPIHTALLR